MLNTLHYIIIAFLRVKCLLTATSRLRTCSPDTDLTFIFLSCLHRSMVDSIRSAAAQCPGFKQSIPLNRDDESRIEAIEKELIKQGSHVSVHELAL